MLTQQQISRKAAEEYRNHTAKEENAFAYGATWASAQYATEIARLEGEKVELVNALKTAKTIIRAWHDMDKEVSVAQNGREYLWAIYETKAPEMRDINELLKKYGNA